MNDDSKPRRKTEGLTSAIKSLQHLLDDVGADEGKPAAAQGVIFEETGEFELTSSLNAFDDEETDDLALVDSHFDMSIPPALPDDDLEQTDNIPTLSETIVDGEIPVLMEAVRLPEGPAIEPAGKEKEYSDQPVKDIDPTIADATEAACDAVQIILRRYRHAALTPEERNTLETLVQEFLEKIRKSPPEDIE